MNINFFIKDGIPTLNPKEILNISNFQIIDVRRPDEFNAELGHIENAILVTLGPELDSFLSSIEKNKLLIFVCRSGVRSAQATHNALLAGFNHVYNLEGGMLKWNSLGLQVIS